MYNDTSNSAWANKASLQSACTSSFLQEPIGYIANIVAVCNDVTILPTLGQQLKQVCNSCIKECTSSH